MTIKLNELYETEKERLSALAEADPIAFVRRYRKRQDIEIAGFLAAQFAYGRIELIRKFLARLFGIMGSSPAEYVRLNDFTATEGMYYRLHKAPDIARLLSVLHDIMNLYGGIGEMIKFHFRGDIRETLWAIGEKLFEKNEDDDLLFFFPKRSSASSLKRWNMYLRWMVRGEDIDFGIWDFIPKSDLVVPLDTHIFKIGQCQGWTTQKTQNWKAARDITDALKRAAPEDPVKFDFLLCHTIGIGGKCSGVRNPSCIERCMLYEV